MAKKIQLKDENGGNLFPKADIYDSGSNTNGSWIKYTDGTMICWKSGWIIGAINILMTSNMYRGGTFQVGALPQNFITAPNYADVSARTAYVTEANMSWSALNGFATTTNFAPFVLFSPTSSTNREIWYNAIAIGKWK